MSEATNSSIKRSPYLVEGNPVTFLPIEVIPSVVEEILGLGTFVQLNVRGRMVKIGDEMLFEVDQIEYPRSGRR